MIASMTAMPVRAMVAALVLALGIGGLSAPAAAQFSAGYKFLEAVKKSDGSAVVEALSDPSSTIVNTRNITTGETALHITVARRDATWTQFLLQRGANPNIADKKGVTPLETAVTLGFADGVKSLLQNGANPNATNSTGETPLIVATHMQAEEIAKLLIENGADPDRADSSGRSARDYAMQDERNPVLAVIQSNDEEGGAHNYGPMIN